MDRNMRFWKQLATTCGLGLVLAAMPAAHAQEQDAPLPALSLQELETLVGPVALYPDDVLAVLLPASTYPLQIVEAQRFLDSNPAAGTTPSSDWDPTVVALLNYPEALELLNDDLEWTATLGEAVLTQEGDVLEAIERFRDAAWLAGNLETDERQRVVRSTDTIEIHPADPEVIYLPYYDPVQVVVRQPHPVVYWYDYRYPLYYHGHWGAFAFNRVFFGLPTFYEIGWRHRHFSYYPFDYGFWWHRRGGFYRHNTGYAARYSRYRRPYVAPRVSRWQHHARAGVSTARYHRYRRAGGQRYRGTGGVREGQLQVRSHRDAQRQNTVRSRQRTYDNVIRRESAADRARRSSASAGRDASRADLASRYRSRSTTATRDRSAQGATTASRARPGATSQNRARSGETAQSRYRSGANSESRARQAEANQSRNRSRATTQSRARQADASQSRYRSGATTRNQSRQDAASQSRARQSSASQSRTRSRASSESRSRQSSAGSRGRASQSRASGSRQRGGSRSSGSRSRQRR